ncbi:MAG: Hsp20/alpha crystallin family protein [Gemmatimonadales bacterium]
MARNPLSPFGFGGVGERGVRSDPPFLSLHSEMNRLFDDVLRGSFGVPSREGQGGQGGTLMPHIDVSETDKELKICAELPGVTENDVEVTLNDDVLTIRGEKKLERTNEQENYHFVERSYGTFQRSLRVPYPVEPEQVQARFEHGVLTVTLPKAEQQQRSRRIQVQAGGVPGRPGAQIEHEPVGPQGDEKAQKAGKRRTGAKSGSGE